MENIFFEIGDRIELTQVSSASRRNVSDKKYGSKLLDFDGVRTAKLSMPILEGRVIPLEVGDEYQLCFFTNAGLYQCRGRVNNRYIDNKMHVMEVFLISELKKFQRRRFYRLDCMFPVKFRVITDVEQLLKTRLDEDDFETEEDKVICQGAYDKIRKNWEEGTVSDLSGGGIRFHSRNEIKKDAKMEILLPLSFSNKIVPMQFAMKVISCTFFEGSRIAFEIRGEFENVKDTERETVIQYVFEEQRRRMRKG